MSPRTIFLIAALVVVFGLVVGVVLVADSRQGVVRTSATASTSPASSALTDGSCHSVDGLPDPKCTPGVADPRVTQDNIRSTICVAGYTATVRPASAYTDALKVRQIKQYGYADTAPADYEEDHLIPLELGGNPTDPANLWPEPRFGSYPASKKDGVENALHSKVCSGSITLASAQREIAVNWESVAS